MVRNTLAVTCGDKLADYHFGDDHAFGPKRQQAFIDGLIEKGLKDRVDWLSPVRCDDQCLQNFHNADYIEQVCRASEKGEGYLDHGDTPARKGIFEAASTVVGSVTDMLDRIMSGEYRRGFIPVAGLHHGYRDHCNGFSVFNDCAIAIEHLRRRYGLRKILYVDIDAHHGDGVMYNYDSDSELYLVDVHEDGRYLYPHTGDADETGSGPAKGTKMNIPLPKDADDALFAEHWQQAKAFLQNISPEFVVFQCGADSMQGDPMAHLSLTENSYRLVVDSLSEVADKACDGRMIALGGGGYRLDNISKAWAAVVEGML